MSTQQIFSEQPQTPFGFAEPDQPGIAFPVTLAEKYQPRQLDQLVGLDGPRRLLENLVKAPRPCAMLFIGKPGIGKTIAGLCFADTLGGSLVHVSSQKCDVATLDALRDRFAYCPPRGTFWVCLVDEADQMSEKAQVQFLSRLDATASLVTGMGGAAVRKSQPPIIWIFTANGTGPQGIIPPSSLEKRFLSRCMVIPFEPLAEVSLSEHLRAVWDRETDIHADPDYFTFLARGGGIRESLSMMQVDLLMGAPRPVAPTAGSATASPSLAEGTTPRPQKVVEVNPAGRYVPQWKRVAAGKDSARMERIQKLLAKNGVETLAREVRTSNAPRAPKHPCLLVKRDDYPQAMALVAKVL